MTEPAGQGLLHIKKYPNRRYYDTTRSCHVTLKGVHDLVVGGHDVCITDSRTGDDITNLVLMQLIVEKDQPKLDLFPSSIMHMIVRANRQVLRGYVDQFFTPFFGVMARSRDQFDSYIRRMMSGQFVSPAEWSSYLAQAFGTSPPPADPSFVSPPPAGSPPPEESAVGASGETVSKEHVPPSELRPGESVEDLRDQLDQLTRRIDELSDRPHATPEDN